jgi:hypothetical protein
MPAPRYRRIRKVNRGGRNGRSWSETYPKRETDPRSRCLEATHWRLRRTRISPSPVFRGSRAFPMIVPGR